MLSPFEQFSQSDLPETVEGQVQGVAKQILAEDEARREEELVSRRLPPVPPKARTGLQAGF